MDFDVFEIKDLGCNHDVALIKHGNNYQFLQEGKKIPELHGNHCPYTLGESRRARKF